MWYTLCSIYTILHLYKSLPVCDRKWLLDSMPGAMPEGGKGRVLIRTLVNLGEDQKSHFVRRQVRKRSASPLAQENRSEVTFHLQCSLYLQEVTRVASEILPTQASRGRSVGSPHGSRAHEARPADWKPIRTRGRSLSGEAWWTPHVTLRSHNCII